MGISRFPILSRYADELSYPVKCYMKLHLGKIQIYFTSHIPILTLLKSDLSLLQILTNQTETV